VDGLGFRAPTLEEFEASFTDPATQSPYRSEPPPPAPSADTLDFDTMLAPDSGFERQLGEATRQAPEAPARAQEGPSYAEFKLDFDMGEPTPGATPAEAASGETAEAPLAEPTPAEGSIPEPPRSVFPDQDTDVITVMQIEPDSAFGPSDRVGTDAPSDTPAADAPPVTSPEAAGEPPAERALDALPAPSGRPGWGVALLTGALIALLLAQLGLMYRKELVQAMPELRPFVSSLCANLGCDMALPRTPEQISIEASDLNRLPELPDVYLLSATLTNRGDSAQAYPHLELTLTDARDQPVVRKVFTPAQWLGAAPEAAGFAAGATRAIEVRFSAEAVSAAGYRLYAFYP
jgi:hypothetical protein